MAYFAGLDVSVKETSVCIVDDAGRIVREVKVASGPDALLAVNKNINYAIGGGPGGIRTRGPVVESLALKTR